VKTRTIHLSVNAMKGVIGLLSAACLSMVMAGCSKDPNDTKLQYLPDMADTPIVKAQREFLAPPEGSVAVNAILYPATADESEKSLQNPYTHFGENKSEQGKKLFGIYCVPCHGEAGKGDGTVAAKFQVPPDITSDVYAKRGDGYFFHVITFGIRNMPSYGYAISANERWQIIMYLRDLQKVAK